METDRQRMPERALSWLPWASMLTLGMAAILWAGIAVLGSTGSASLGWRSFGSGREAGEAEDLSQAFRTAAKRALPAVVVIKTSNKTQVTGGGRNGEHFQGPGFEYSADGEDYDGQQAPDEPEPGLGSGVVIDARGIVLTNHHVVEGADELLVQLADGRQFPATIDKTDSRLDLAVLRVKSETRLPAADLGDAETLEIGDWVLAIGSPFELEQTVSAGIISAKGRSLDSAKNARFLQTDAAIDPGSSGGPLVNLAGEVVGITTAIASRSGGYQGVAFAIPINLAKQLLSSQPDGKH